MFCYTTVLSGVRHLDVHISSALPSFETQFESPGGDFTSSLEHEYHNAVKSVISLQSCRWDLCAFLSALFSACPPASLSTSPSAVLTSHHIFIVHYRPRRTVPAVFTIISLVLLVQDHPSHSPYLIERYRISHNQSYVLIPGTPSSHRKNKLRTCTVGAPLVSRPSPELLWPCRV